MQNGGNVSPLMLIILFLMNREFIELERKQINDKTFVVPSFDLQGYEKYLSVPKMDIKGMHHVYYGPQESQELYKQNNMDPENLPCNLDYKPSQDEEAVKKQQQQLRPKESKKESSQVQVKPEGQKAEVKQQEPMKQESTQQKLNKKRRPPLREKGYTHFIQIPLFDFCQDIYRNIVAQQIDTNDSDALVDPATLHVTLMVVRINKLEDIIKWQQVVKGLKLRKSRLTIRGVGIFPVKPNTNFTKVLYAKVEGIEEIVDDLVSRAISKELITQKQLSNIVFDKRTDSFRMQQPHLTLLKTKGKDIIDATPYLKTFAKLNFGKTNIPKVTMSMIGSFEKGQYFDEFEVSSAK